LSDPDRPDLGSAGASFLPIDERDFTGTAVAWRQDKRQSAFALCHDQEIEPRASCEKRRRNAAQIARRQAFDTRLDVACERPR